MTRKRTSTLSSCSLSTRWSASSKTPKALRFSTTKIRLMSSLKGWIRVMAPTWSRIKLCKVVLVEFDSTRKMSIKDSLKGSAVICARVPPLLPVRQADSFQINNPNGSLAKYTTRTSSTTFHIRTNNPHPWWTTWCQGTRAEKRWPSYLQLHLQTLIRTKSARASTAVWGSLVLIAIQTPWFNKSRP